MERCPTTPVYNGLVPVLLILVYFTFVCSGGPTTLSLHSSLLLLKLLRGILRLNFIHTILRLKEGPNDFEGKTYSLHGVEYGDWSLPHFPNKKKKKKNGFSSREIKN